MKSGKKVTLTLMLCLSCILFTGCSNPIKDLQDSFAEWQDGRADAKAEKETVGLLQGIQGYNTNSKTTKAANKLANAQFAYSSAKADLKATPEWPLDKIPFIGSMLPFTPHNIAKKNATLAQANLTKSTEAFKLAEASDKTLAKDKEARKKAAQQQGSGIVQKVIIVVGVIIALIVLLLLFKKFRKPKPKKPEEPKPVEDKKKHTGLLEVNYDNLLKDNCGKCNLNAAEVSNMFGGNTRLASDAVQYCATKGMKGDEAMEYVKKKAKHFKDYGN